MCKNCEKITKEKDKEITQLRDDVMRLIVKLRKQGELMQQMITLSNE